jgi:hypothetical protein
VKWRILSEKEERKVAKAFLPLISFLASDAVIA